jgi:hypothetical protein
VVVPDWNNLSGWLSILFPLGTSFLDEVKKVVEGGKGCQTQHYVPISFNNLKTKL